MIKKEDYNYAKKHCMTEIPVLIGTGTTMMLTAMTEATPDPDCDLALHYGFKPDSYVLLPVMESGGVCLGWFRHTCMNNLDYDTLDARFLKAPEMDLLFLPLPRQVVWVRQSSPPRARVSSKARKRQPRV